MKISARNMLKGKIIDVVEGATAAHVRIKVGAAVITASITNEAVKELGLKKGMADRKWLRPYSHSANQSSNITDESLVSGVAKHPSFFSTRSFDAGYFFAAAKDFRGSLGNALAGYLLRNRDLRLQAGRRERRR